MLFAIGIIAILFLAASLGSWLEENPVGYLLVILCVGLIAAVWHFAKVRRQSTKEARFNFANTRALALPIKVAMPE